MAASHAARRVCSGVSTCPVPVRTGTRESPVSWSRVIVMITVAFWVPGEPVGALIPRFRAVTRAS